MKNHPGNGRQHAFFWKKYVVQSFMLHNFVPNHNLSDPIYMCFEKNVLLIVIIIVGKSVLGTEKKSGKEERKRLEPPPPPPHKTELPRTRNTFFELREKEVSVETDLEQMLPFRSAVGSSRIRRVLKKLLALQSFGWGKMESHHADGGGGGNNFLTSFSLLSWMHAHARRDETSWFPLYCAKKKKIKKIHITTVSSRILKLQMAKKDFTFPSNPFPR